MSNNTGRLKIQSLSQHLILIAELINSLILFYDLFLKFVEGKFVSTNNNILQSLMIEVHGQK